MRPPLRKSKQSSHQGCLDSIHHNLGIMNSPALVSLSGPQPWLQATIQYEQPQRTPPTVFFFFLILCKKKEKGSDCVFIGKRRKMWGRYEN